MSDDKKKHKGMALMPCPEHGMHTRPVTFEFDDEEPATGETVYQDEQAHTSVGYSRKYAAQWEAVFGSKKAEA